MQNILLDMMIDGRYRVLKKLGAGGMGSVYEAEQVELSRIVALKFLHSQLLNDEESRERFHREALALSRLQHSHLTIFYAFGFYQEKIPYIVMEFMQGETLSAVLAEKGRLPWQRAAEIGRQIADAMAYCHSAGIVHRDLKPENIILKAGQQSDFASVTDFGLVKFQEGVDAETLTQTGMLVGSVQYMSPEQCAGRAVTTASDCYALGCILFQMLEGHVPFSAETPIGTIHMQIKDPVPEFKLALPRELKSLIKLALDKDPGKRPSMQEINKCLSEILESEVPVESPVKEISTKRILPGKFFCYLLVLVASLILIFALKSVVSSINKSNPPLVKKYFRTAKYYFDAGYQLGKKGKKEEAIDEFEHAASIKGQRHLLYRVKALEAISSTCIELSAWDRACEYALKLQKELEGADLRNDFELRDYLARSYSNLAWGRKAQNRLSEAKLAVEKALELIRGLPELEGTLFARARNYLLQAEILQSLNDHRAAAKAARSAIAANVEHIKRYGEKFPEELLSARVRLMKSLAALHETDACLNELESLISLCRRIKQNWVDRNFGFNLVELADVCIGASELETCRTVLEKAQNWANHLPASDRDMVSALICQSRSRLIRSNDKTGASELLSQSFHLLKRSGQADAIRFAGIYTEARDMGNYDLAEEALNEAVKGIDALPVFMRAHERYRGELAMADLKARKGDLKEAKALLAKLIPPLSADPAELATLKMAKALQTAVDRKESGRGQ